MRTVAVGGVLVAIAALTAGCASQSGPSPKPAANAGKKDIASWALPLDPYRPPKWDVVSHARGVLTERCMSKTQYAWQYPMRAVDPPIGESWNPVGRKLLSPELAAKYGYGNSDEYILSKADSDAFVRASRVHLDEAGVPDLDRCQQEATKRLRADHDPYALVSRVQFAKESSADARRKREAVGRWKQCMRPVGIAALPDNPEDMASAALTSDAAQPPHALDERPEAPTPVSDREKEVAVADAKCQVSSGYIQAAYNAEWNAELRALTENADALERERREANAQRERARDVIVGAEAQD